MRRRCRRKRNAPEVTVPLEQQGVTVGRLLLGARRNGRPFETDDLALLADNANAVAAAITRRALWADLETGEMSFHLVAAPVSPAHQEDTP
jgi:hypothetical protein